MLSPAHLRKDYKLFNVSPSPTIHSKYPSIHFLLQQEVVITFSPAGKMWNESMTASPMILVWRTETRDLKNLFKSGISSSFSKQQESLLVYLVNPSCLATTGDSKTINHSRWVCKSEFSSLKKQKKRKICRFLQLFLLVSAFGTCSRSPGIQKEPSAPLVSICSPLECSPDPVKPPQLKKVQTAFPPEPIRRLDLHLILQVGHPAATLLSLGANQWTLREPVQHLNQTNLCLLSSCQFGSVGMELLSFSWGWFYFISLVQTDVFKVLLGPAKPHVVGNHLRRVAQLFISQRPGIRSQMLQMFFFFLFVRKRFWRFWFQSRMIRFWFQTGMMGFKLGAVITIEGFFFRELVTILRCCGAGQVTPAQVSSRVFQFWVFNKSKICLEALRCF